MNKRDLEIAMADLREAERRVLSLLRGNTNAITGEHLESCKIHIWRALDDLELVGREAA